MESYAASPQQTRLLELAKQAPEGAFQAACRLRLSGEVDARRLRQALLRVVARHEILSTVLHQAPELTAPLQTVMPADAAWDQEDWSDLEPALRDERSAAWLAAPAEPLRRLPVLHASLRLLAPGSGLLSLALPAHCADRRALENLVRELFAAYQDPRQDRAGAEGAALLQYADLAAWQNEALAAPERAKEREHWQQLGLAAWLATRLPNETTCHGGPPVEVGRELPAGLAAGLRALARSTGSSEERVLFCAWQILLARLLRRGEILVAAPFAGRGHESLEGLPGLFARFLPVAVRVDEEEPLAAALCRLGEALARAARAEASFAWQGIDPGAGQPPRLPFGFELRTLPDALTAGGLTVSWLELRAPIDQQGALLACRCDGGTIRTELTVAGGRMDPVGAERLLSQYHALLRSLVARPEAPVGDLDLRSPEDLGELRRLNDSRRDLANDRCLPLRLAEQAARTPDLPAVSDARCELTYAELRGEVSRLAGRLRALGVGPDVRVAVCAERSVGMVVALLAVLEAGGAWVALDPEYPPERLALLLEEARPAVVLAEEALAGRLAAGDIPIVPIGQPGATAVAEPMLQGPELSLDHLAYVCYTSGSTGRPKGVAISHRAIANRLLWMQRELPLHPGDRVLQKTSISFDAAVWEILSPLLAGAHLVLARPGGQRDPAYLLELMAQREITVLQLVPSQLRLLLQAAGIERCDRLRTLFCGGEALPAGLAAEFHARHGAALHNLYGPTETAIDALSWPCPRTPEDGLSTTVPIGRPIANAQVYLLSARLAPQPVGAVAELFLGGAGLARGYLGRPDLTAERFLPDPFAAAPGARMYRTGDLGRARLDGSVEFLGRADQQLKVRGFRIEPGEVEAALVRHPEVQAAVVGSDGAEGLAAWVVPVAGRRPAALALRRWLEGSLPGFMVPSAFAFLAALPQTPGGKVDRRALPALSPATAPAGERSLPRSFTEEALADLWREVLDVDAAGARDHFFAAGGHSLLVVQMMARVAQVFGVQLPLRTLFDTPTLGGLAAAIDTALRKDDSRALPPLVAGRRDGAIPLSFAQQRLWFLDRLDPGLAAYNITLALRLQGPLDLGALRAAVEALAGRHESLRTTFPEVDGRPVQRISPLPDAEISRVDLDALPAARRAPAAWAVAQAAAGRSFDLGAGPLLRLTLLRQAPDDHAVVLAMHHIVSDGWSTGVLLRDFTALYHGFAHDRPALLPDLPVQYADFAIWQRQWLQGEELGAQVAWWRRLLGPAPPPLELPTDRPRPKVPSLRGRARPIVFPTALADALDRLGLQRGATLFMVLLAGFGALLHRYSGQRTLLIGSPAANRNRVELEGLIGFFVNTLVFPVAVDPADGFAALLAAVRELCLGAAAHQDLPFEKLVEELQPARDAGRPQLLQVMLALQTARAEVPAVSRLTLTPLALEARTAKLDLTLDLTRQRSGLRGVLEHSVELFDGATIDRFASHLLALLTAAASHPERPVADLAFLSAAEHWQLVGEWNGLEEELIRAEPLHRRFARQAALMPEATALVWGETRISFGALERRANRLAHALRDLGVGPDARVFLCAERSPELVLGILGILKAGGSYIPLDPEYPRQRLAELLSDWSTAPLLAAGPVRDRLPALEGRPWLDLDAAAAADADADADAEPPAVRVEPENLAYTFYTSGSTGRPKGVEISHLQVARLLAVARPAVGFGSGDVWTLFHSFAFDVSVWEMWGALLYGGRLVIVPYEVSRTPELFRELLVREKVTILCQTPSAFLPLSRAVRADGGRLPALRRVLFAGEALEPGSLLPWLAIHGDDQPQLINLYGITETTVHVTWHRVTAREAELGLGRIGRHLPDLQVHLLDAHGQLVPVGVPGEIHVAGAGVARGYAGAPERTAERFLPDPFGRAPGGRMYRSGDLARRHPDGSLEYLGRIDHQVKVRGFRIEPAEIEAALRRHPAVREAVVIARGASDARDGAGERRLVAYLTGAAVPAPEELRAWLQRDLPAYMIPAAFVPLGEFPLTANGKIDRRALPDPGVERPRLEREFLPPRNAVEEILAGVWTDLLGVDPIGIEDDFFALGGHSLLAAQVLSRMERHFRVRVPLRALFAEPTVAGLARQIAAAEPPLDPAEPISRRIDPLTAPLSFAQQRLWFLDQWEPANPVYTLGSAFRVTGALDPAVLSRCLDEVVRRHETLRTTFPAVAGTPVQRIGPPPSLRLPRIDLAGLPAERREAAMRTQAAGYLALPFDLSRDSLLRAVLWLLGPEDHALLLATHHIVADGWSLGILAREMLQLYAAFSAGDPSPLPELPCQYGDFAVWQRERLQGARLDARLAFWREDLAGAPELLSLPLDHPRPAAQSSRGAAVSLAIPAELGTALRTLSRSSGTTLFMTLLAGFATLLGRYAEATDVVIGTPVAHHEPPATESLIGLFVNTLALRVRLAGAPAFRGLLDRVRETTLGAFEHQDLPLEKLVDELGLAREPSHTPLFQAVLALQNLPAVGLSLPALRFQPVGLDVTTTKFDLVLSLVEDGAGLLASLAYRSELFEPPTASRLLGHLRVLLAGAAAAPDGPIGELPWLTGEERTQLLAAWNGWEEAPVPLPLHLSFAEQAARSPHAVALTCAGVQLTWAELELRANRLAHALRRAGVGAETRVGLYVEPSCELVIGILGILKADGAYLPLDPEAPPERLARLMALAGARVLVTMERLAGRLPAQGLTEVRLDGPDLDQEPGEPPASGAVPGQLAYVLFTSGSTGTPKGVEVSHFQVARLFAAARPAVGFGSGDVWTLFHSFAFDFSVWEIWGALLHGGRLVIVPYEVSRTPELFRELLLREEVTILSQTPSAFLALSRAVRAAGSRLPALRRIVFGGEALEPGSLRSWLEVHGDDQPQLINLYGITETTVHVTWHRVTAREAELGIGRIGRPLPDLQVHLLDSYGQLVPVGVAGEIHVAGAGVARGYAGAPQRTAERFLPDPFGRSPEGGGRMYRSGDLARRHPDGNLEYLGRLDHQVKVRGFRIEPAEIEAALRRHPAVREAVVIARGDSAERRLAAYLTGAAVPAPEELRAWLQRTLPAYMIPAAFVPLGELPLTANGKVDRRALPDPGQARPDLATAYTAPRGLTEEILAQVWAQVLDVDQVGVDDNFFVLGGDSILSLRVRALAEERGVRFTLLQLFTHQTVARLAAALHAEGGDGLGEAVLPVAPFALVSAADRALLPADVVDAYPLTAVQAGMLYHMAYLPEAIVYHNVYSYHLRAPFDAAAFLNATQRVVDRHPILRTSFDLTAGSEPLQRVHRGAELRVEVDDWRHCPPAEQSRLLSDFVEREKLLGFDLSQPPLVRFGLHRRSDETFNFSLTECHPIFDGWSLHAFLNEVFETYLALLAGRDPAGQPLQMSIADFVALERAALATPAAQSFWDDKLAGCKPGSLPGRRAGARRTEGQGMRMAVLRLPDALSAGLKSLARGAAVPLKSVLLTAHLEVMSAWSGEREVVTGLLCSGRPEGPGADRILGLFFNAVPFRITLSSAPWTQRVQEVFAAEREILPHRRYPLAQLQKSRGGKPLFEVLFNYIHFHMLRRLLSSGDVELLGDAERWEENSLPLGVIFMQNPVTGGLHLLLRHDADQLEPATAKRLLASYQRALEAMAGTSPYTSAHRLSAAERHQALCEWNDTGRPAPPALFLDRFARQVREAPEAPAIAWEGRLVSYRELAAAANRLARWLRRLGVGIEGRVGLYLRRAPDLLVALLGTLKAGAAYVPLDPLHPPERIAQLIAEARLGALLTQDELAGRLAAEATPGMPVLRLDGESHLPAAESDEDPEWEVPPEAAAYVLFTSGSTGVPKGVVVEHRQLASYLGGILEHLPIPADASFALVSTFAADLGNTVIFPSLATGGCLHVIAEERCADAAALEEILGRHPADVLKIVPSHLAALLGSARHPERLLPRACLVLGGETLEPSLLATLASLGARCAVFNHYGPTETTVGATLCRLEAAAPGEPVPLGRPLAGARTLVLDGELDPVLPGAPGELCIAGAGLARGYLGRPDLTAERFVPQPAPGRPGERIYRTGDQARHLPDGRLEFLGRQDGQVKIRGFRIELREIEIVLGRHAGVRECAVSLHQEIGGEGQLVAFCAAAGEDPPGDAELRGFLRRSLPSYMLPAAFVWLATLPRNANGKLDRRALPATGGVFAAWRADYVAPRSELERTIAAVWQEGLQLPRVGMDDNFFDLGGHSLVMLRVHSLLRQALQRDLPMVALFEHPTVGSLAEHLSRQQTATATPLAEEAGQRADARHAALGRRRRRQEGA